MRRITSLLVCLVFFWYVPVDVTALIEATQHYAQEIRESLDKDSAILGFSCFHSRITSEECRAYIERVKSDADLREAIMYAYKQDIRVWIDRQFAVGYEYVDVNILAPTDRVRAFLMRDLSMPIDDS